MRQILLLESSLPSYLVGLRVPYLRYLRQDNTTVSMRCSELVQLTASWERPMFEAWAAQEADKADKANKESLVLAWNFFTSVNEQY